MKIILTCALILSLHAAGQSDTTITYYYESGKLKAVCPMLNGKTHGTVKNWYENGQLSMVSRYKKGKQIETTMFQENGRKSYYVRAYKWRVKIKLWYPDGKLWSSSKTKYARSIERGYDSTGILVHKIIEKKGSLFSCLVLADAEDSDSLMYRDGSCTCGWGKVFWRNGVWIDEKGRDLVTDYSYTRFDYYRNGALQKETTWNVQLGQYTIREWDENGNLLPAIAP